MKLHDFIIERASPVLYHYTGVAAALDILTTGVFQLSSVTGNRSEEQYAPSGYPYFLSTARTRVGDYVRYLGSSAVMFVMDGEWFNRNYRVKPIDYWERSWLQSGTGRTRESEDRVFSKQPMIPIDGVREVHFYIKEQDEYRSPRVRQALIAAKTRGIATYLYDNERAFRLLDKRHSISPAQAAAKLVGTVPTRITRSDRNDLEEWLELIYKKSRSELTPRADKLAFNIIYYGRFDPNSDQNLGVDLSNSRKPSSGSSRQGAIKVINYMRQNGIKSTVELKNLLAKKWAEITEREKSKK